MVQRQEVLEIHGHLTSFDLVVAPLVDAELLWRLPCSPVSLLEPNGENTVRPAGGHPVNGKLGR